MPREKMTIQQMWTKYHHCCVPPNAAATQVKETRMAFFAGFISMFEINLIIGSDMCSEESGVELLENFKVEIAEYMRLMGVQEDDRRNSYQ